MKKKRKTHHVYLPDAYLNEATGAVEPAYEVDQLITSDGKLADILGVGRQTVQRWKAAGIITSQNPRPGVCHYDLKKTLEELKRAGYQFEHELRR